MTENAHVLRVLQRLGAAPMGMLLGAVEADSAASTALREAAARSGRAPIEALAAALVSLEAAGAVAQRAPRSRSPLWVAVTALAVEHEAPAPKRPAPRPRKPEVPKAEVPKAEVAPEINESLVEVAPEMAPADDPEPMWHDTAPRELALLCHRCVAIHTHNLAAPMTSRGAFYDCAVCGWNQMVFSHTLTERTQEAPAELAQMLAARVILRRRLAEQEGHASDWPAKADKRCCKGNAQVPHSRLIVKGKPHYLCDECLSPSGPATGPEVPVREAMKAWKKNLAVHSCSAETLARGLTGQHDLTAAPEAQEPAQASTPADESPPSDASDQPWFEIAPKSLQLLCRSCCEVCTHTLDGDAAPQWDYYRARCGHRQPLYRAGAQKAVEGAQEARAQLAAAREILRRYHLSQEPTPPGPGLLPRWPMYAQKVCCDGDAGVPHLRVVVHVLALKRGRVSDLIAYYCCGRCWHPSGPTQPGDSRTWGNDEVMAALYAWQRDGSGHRCSPETLARDLVGSQDLVAALEAQDSAEGPAQTSLEEVLPEDEAQEPTPIISEAAAPMSQAACNMKPAPTPDPDPDPEPSLSDRALAWSQLLSDLRAATGRAWLPTQVRAAQAQVLRLLTAGPLTSPGAEVAAHLRHLAATGRARRQWGERWVLVARDEAGAVEAAEAPLLALWGGER
jgi:hypothetical protein